MGYVYKRGSKLWIGVTGADGKVRQMSTGLSVGQERKARQVLNRLEARIEAQTLVRVSDESDEDAIVSASARSGIVFVGLAGGGDRESALLAGYGPLLERLKGHAFLCRSWHELEM